MKQGNNLFVLVTTLLLILKNYIEVLLIFLRKKFCVISKISSPLSHQASDITSQVFGSSSDGIIGAFGDFNSDELTDVFVIKENGHVLEVLLGSDVEPLLRNSITLRCQFDNLQITSVVPGDFDGDAFMDLLITTKTSKADVLGIYINWGGLDRLNCSVDKEPIIEMIGEPVALDYNKDMIIDLFGLSVDSVRTFWVFNSDRYGPIISNRSMN